MMAAAWVQGCGRRESMVKRAGRDGVLLRGNGTEPEALDPHIVRGAAEWTIAAALFEGLTVPDPGTLEPRPGVAEGWEVSADGRTYTFRLREGVRWSNGDALTAEDFVWSARRLLAPALGAAHAEDTLIFVRGAEAWLRGETEDWATVGIRVVDTRTVVFELEHPTPFFPSALVQFYPVHRASVEAAGAVTQRGGDWTRPGRLVGNGPFVLQSWRANQELVVGRNEQYWDARAVRLKGVRFFPFENPATEEAAFRNEQLHLTSSLPLQKIEVYERERPGVLKIVPDLGVYFYTLNVTRPPFDDVRVRRALSLATDRRVLVERVLRGGRRPASAFTPPGLAGYEANARLRHDPEAARALLAEAGLAGGTGFPVVELVIDSRDFHRVVAEALQQMWARELGITVRLRAEETRVLIASKRAMQFDLIRGSWNAATYQDPWYFLGPWVSGGLYNEAKWSDARYDALIVAAQAEVDGGRRLELLREAEDRLLEALPVLPLFWGTQVFLVSEAVTGYQEAPFADRLVKGLGVE